MPVKGKTPTVSVIQGGRKPALAFEPEPSIEDRAKALLVGRTIETVVVSGDYLVITLDNAQTLQFFCQGGFKEHIQGH